MTAIGQEYVAKLAALIILTGIIAIAAIVSWATKQSRTRATTRHRWGQDTNWGHQYYGCTPGPPWMAGYYNTGHQGNRVQWPRTPSTPLWPGILIGAPEWPNAAASDSGLPAAPLMPPTPAEEAPPEPCPAPQQLQQRRRLSYRGASSIDHRVCGVADVPLRHNFWARSSRRQATRRRSTRPGRSGSAGLRGCD